MFNEPTVSGKKVSFSIQQFNFLLDIHKNEMYSLDTYLTGRLREHSDKLSKMHFLEMINSDALALQRQGIKISDSGLLVLTFRYLKTITTFLDDVIIKLKNNKYANVQKILGELHDTFTVSWRVFVGYNQSQLIEALRLILNHIEVSRNGRLSASQNKFCEICQSCAENESFLPDYQRQLSSWIDIIKRHRYLPLDDIKMAVPGKSILKKPQEK